MRVVWDMLLRSSNKNFIDFILKRIFTLEFLHTALNDLPVSSVFSDLNNLDVFTVNKVLFRNRASRFSPLDFKQNVKHRRRYALAQSYSNSIGICGLCACIPTITIQASFLSSPESHLITGNLFRTMKTLAQKNLIR